MNRRAFTLIELLIVLSIVALLAAVAIPSIQRSITQTPSTGQVLYKAETLVVFPEATGYVNDGIGLLSAADKQYIVDIATAMEPYSQIAVCIVGTTGGLSIEDYSIKLAEKWAVGHAGKDDGIILIVAKDDRKLRIEVGRGLEGKIPDAEAGRIINDIIVPQFKQGQFSTGVRMGVAKIVEDIQR